MPLKLLVPFQSILGVALTSFRSETALDQAAMAKALDMSAANLSRLENGHGNLTVEQLFNACQILDVSPTRFISLVEETKRTMEAENIKVLYTKGKEVERGYMHIARETLKGFLDRVTELHARLDPNHSKKYGNG